MSFPLDPKDSTNEKQDNSPYENPTLTSPSSAGERREDREAEVTQDKEKTEPNREGDMEQALATTSHRATSPLRSREERKRLLDEEMKQNKRRAHRETIDDSERESSREAKRKKEKRETKWLKVRVVPIWVRLLIVLILCAAALAGGAMVGYGIIGKGNPMAVFHISTWTHIRDVIYAKK